MSDGMVHNVYYRDVSGVAASGMDGLVFWFLYVKETSPSTMPNCPRYTEEDGQATMNQYGHLNLGPNYTFLDLWEARVRAAMVPLEEGVVEGLWNSGGRVELLGDSVAKVRRSRYARYGAILSKKMLTGLQTGDGKPWA